MRHVLACLVICACAPASVSVLTDGGGADGVASDVPVASPDAPAANDVPVALVDAGARADAASSLGEPSWVDVDVRTNGRCPPPLACGGPVEGTWDVAGVCLEVPIEDALSRCPGARVTRRGGRARGRVTFAERIALRRAEWSAEVQVLIPAVCATFVGGCPGIQTALRAVAPDSVCQATTIGDCDCTARQAGALGDGDGYATENGQIVSSTLMRRWDYCITGDALRYRDVSAREPREPGVITLGRR